ncbi:MAG: acyltransferase [Lachnospiraceae bacterium]|nr:acyltransferase [Lachnospiraceae bacterium]
MEKKDVYNIAKFITVFLVVLAHVTRMYTGIGVVTPVMKSLFLKYVTEYIYSFHMPLFILLSGCVFGYCIEQGKYKDRFDFIVKKCKRLVFPYFVFGLCYVTPVMVLLHFTKQSFWEYFIEGIVFSRNSRHLWYILALFWIFVIAVFLRNVLLDGKKLFLVMCVSVMVYFLSERIEPVFQWKAAASYQIFFFLGVCVNKYFDYVFAGWKEKWYLAIPFGLLILLRFTKVGKDFYLLYAILGIVMILGISTYLSEKNFMRFSIVKKINNNGYGIYFFHPMIIYGLFAITYQKSIPPMLLSTVIFGISFVMSYYLTVMVKKLHMGCIIGD